MAWESWIKPENCPGPCNGCEGLEHHWLESSFDPENEDHVGHPAFSAEGVRHPDDDDDDPILIWSCKHCDAWLPLKDFDPEDAATWKLLPGGKSAPFHRWSHLILP